MVNFVLVAQLVIACVFNLATAQVETLEIEDGERDDCPTSLWWVTMMNETCQCDLISGMKPEVKCENLSLHLELGYCISWNGQERAYGACPFLPDHHTYTQYYNITPDVHGHDPNNTCRLFNRERINCGKCVSGYGPAIFSDNVACADCKKHRYVWFAYLLFQLVLETALFFILVLLKPTRAFGLINILTFYWQMILYAITTNSSLYGRLLVVTNDKVLQFLLTIYGVWNLDFIRYIMPPLCISSATKAIDTLWFDIIIVLYPLLLCCSLLLCIKLHDQNNQGFSFILRPLRRVFRREWNLKDSAAVTFSVFFISGYSKLLFTSLKFLKGVQTQYNRNGTEEYNLTLYYDPSINYLSLQHIPYIIVSAVILITFIITPPLLLLLFPIRPCRKCTTHLGLGFLGKLINIFQGVYKDGTEGTFNYRSFSALYMILRIGIACEFMFIVIPYEDKNTGLSWAITGLVLIGFGAVYFTVEPFCVPWMNKFDGFTLTLLGLLALTINFNDTFVYVIALLISLTPWAIIGSNSLTKVSRQVLNSPAVRIMKWRLKVKCERCLKRGERHNEEEEPLLEESSSDMPDRIVNPSHYLVPELHITNGGASQRERPMNVPTYGVV